MNWPNRRRSARADVVVTAATVREAARQYKHNPSPDAPFRENEPDRVVLDEIDVKWLAS
jgi:hypothetical protein